MTTPDTPEPRCTVCAARVPGGAAGEALEAAREEFAEIYDGLIDAGTHIPDRCSYSYDNPCTCQVKADLDSLIALAAARAPGPVGGELEAAVGAIREEGRDYFDHADEWDLSSDTAHKMARLFKTLFEAYDALAAPAEPGGG